MHITTALSVDLGLLTQALDRPGTDIAETLHHLTADIGLAVPSYLGLSLTTAGDAPFIFTDLEENKPPSAVASSLLMPLPIDGSGNLEAPPELILFAARAGAFVDLAADLSWLTGIELAEYTLDQHLSVLAHLPTGRTVHATSAINQAIGVLIGRGRSAETAHEELASQAADASTDLYTAAIHILRGLPTTHLGRRPTPTPVVDRGADE